MQEPENKAVLPADCCEVVDTAQASVIPPPKPVIKLCLFKEPLTAVETISRTLRYAQDPQQYLLETLGEVEFSARKHLFCLQTEEITLDTYGTGTTKQAFEAHIAGVLGKLHGVFFLTGVQAQLAALATYAELSGRKKVAWHITSHLECAESGAYEKLYGLKRVLLGTSADALPTVEQIANALTLERDELAAIVLEIPNRTLGCQSYSFETLRQISWLCREAGVALHCDGARLWEIEPWYAAGIRGNSIAEVCGCFDSVYVSFYKGLGGLTGAMLVHDKKEFIEDVKVWQRRAGGNAFTLGIEVTDCQRAFNEVYGTFAKKRDKMRRIVDGIRAVTKGFSTDEGEAVVEFVPSDATCSQILTVFRGFQEQELVEARDRVQARSGVRVFERLLPKQTLDEKMAADRMKAKSPPKHGTSVPKTRGDSIHLMEWMIMEVTEKIKDEVFLNGYLALCRELIRGNTK